MQLTREALLRGELQRLVAARGDIRTLSEDELLASRAATLRRRPAGADLWVFAYGSLIWNPTFHWAERRTARLYGYHRQFGLWTSLGRGSPDRPGLMLGLERGGSCRGVAFRIAPEAIATETEALWRREMVTGAYHPTLVRAHTSVGPVSAVAFVINTRHERYAAGLEEAAIVAAVATAEGPLGRCRDYLFNTVTHLAELGIRDGRLTRLAAAVRASVEGPAISS